MSEKFQYGQKVEFQGTTLVEFKTSKSYVEYVKTTYHGKMLLMDGEIQYSTQDEHRYHSVLLWGAISNSKRKVLILGGGDGLAAKWLYKSNIEGMTVTIVDWDREFVEFAKRLPESEGALEDPRTTLVHQDALEYIRNSTDQFDAIIIDLPDPDGNEGLYTDILGAIHNVCGPHSIVTTHVGPVSLCKEHPGWTFIRKCKDELRNLVGTVVYDRIYVPSFSHEWGFLTCYRGHSARLIRPHYEMDTLMIPYNNV